MKTRIIQTRFWDDEFVVEADKLTKYLYIYILTSQYINISGIFQLHDKKIMMETDLTPKQLKDAKAELTKKYKVLFKDGWVCVLNAEKNNRYRNSPKNETAYEKELAVVPVNIKSFFLESDTSMHTTIDSSIGSSSDTNHKSKTINHKSKTINKIEELDFSKFEHLTPNVLEDIAEQYNVPFEFVEERRQDMEVWLGRKSSNRYKNYRLALMKWVRDEKKNYIKSRANKRGGVIDVRE